MFEFFGLVLFFESVFGIYNVLMLCRYLWVCYVSFGVVDFVVDIGVDVVDLMVMYWVELVLVFVSCVVGFELLI